MTTHFLCDKILKHFGVWLSLVERLVRDQEAGSSNLLTPTTPNPVEHLKFDWIRCFYMLIKFFLLRSARFRPHQKTARIYFFAAKIFRRIFMAGDFQPAKKIKDVIESIESSEWILPNIQRKFVWDKDRICDLFDSLMRGYPISSFMIWKVNKDTATKNTFYKFLQHYQEKWQEDSGEFKPCGKDYYYAVIDGQQRLNSIYIGYTGSYAEKLPRVWWKKAYDESIQPKEELYLNIGRYANEELTDRKFDFCFMSRDVHRAEENNQWWFRVGDILNFDYTEEDNLDDEFESIVEKKYSLANFGTERSFALNILKRLYKTTFYKKVINYYQEEIQDLDNVVDIFVRANRGGVPLSFSDLVMSVTISQWPESREKIDALVKLIFADYDFSIDKDFVLKVFLVLFSNDIRFRVNNFDHLSGLISKVKGEQFDPICNAIKKTCNFVKQIGFTDSTLRSKYALIPIIYYVYKNKFDIDNLAKHKEEKQQIAVWLRLALLKGMFGGKPDAVLVKIREIINKHPGKFPTQEIIKEYKNKSKDISITREYILDKIKFTEYQSADAYLILSLATSVDPQHEYHIDHMYPKTMFEKKNLQKLKFLEENDELFNFYNDKYNWNTVGNLQLLNKIENGSKNDSTLEEWMKRTTDYDWTLYCFPKDETGNYIIAIDQFKSFVEKRRNLIADRILENLAFDSSNSFEE